MTFNTGNPIGSTDARDLSDNTENMDYLENSTTELTHSDRLGTARKTRHGMEVEHDAQIAAHETEHDAQIAAHETEHDAQIAAHETEHDAQMQSFENDFDARIAGMAFTRVGSFTTGATLTDTRQVLVWEVSQGGDGREYSWAGTFPKVVAAGATPATSGGIGAGAWFVGTDVTLRGDLAAVTGASLVNTSTGETVEDRLSDIDDSLSSIDSSLSSIDSSLSSIETSLSGKADLAGSASQTFSVADATDPHHAVSYGQYLTTPTDTMAGIVRRATDAEEIAGTSDVGFLTPLGLRKAVNAAGAAPIFAVRAWVNFNGTKAVAIRASGNVSSITDNGTGDYTVNFTSAMVDGNYSATTSSEFGEACTTSFLNTSCRVGMYGSSGIIGDAVYVSVAINR